MSIYVFYDDFAAAWYVGDEFTTVAGPFEQQVDAEAYTSIYRFTDPLSPWDRA